MQALDAPFRAYQPEILLQLSLSTAGAAWDLYTTEKCLQERRCVEGNSLLQTRTRRVVFKILQEGIHYALMWVLYELPDKPMRKLSFGVTAGFTGFQIHLGIHNNSLGGER